MMKRFVLGTIFVLIIVLSSLTVIAYIYRDIAPEELKSEAWKSIEKARAEGTARYAGEGLVKAERVYRIGLSMLERESAKIYFLRNFGVSRSLFQDAMRHAKSAVELAKTHREFLKVRAESKIRNAEKIAGKVEKLTESFLLDSVKALKWSRAKIALREAEIYYRSEEYAKAAEKADDAIRQLEDVQHSVVQVARRFLDWNELQKWKYWVNETIEYSRKKRTSAIVVDKLDHTLILYRNGKKVRSFKADLGPNVINEKYYEGDNTTPEGKYRIIRKRGIGQTKYYKALLLDYPNKEDKRRFLEAKRKGMISKMARIGGMIEIHGEGGQDTDWTEGCVALSNKDMDDLFRQVRVRTPVTIVGCRNFNKEFARLINTN